MHEEYFMSTQWVYHRLYLARHHHRVCGEREWVKRDLVRQVGRLISVGLIHKYAHIFVAMIPAPMKDAV